MGKLKEPFVRPMAYLMTKIVHQLYNSIHLLESEIIQARGFILYLAFVMLELIY
jgi:hypothetical protein